MHSAPLRFIDYSKTYSRVLLQIYTPDHSKGKCLVHQNLSVFCSHVIQHLFSNNPFHWSFILFGCIFFCPDIQKLVFTKCQFGAPFKCLWPFNGKQWIQSSNPEPSSINNWPLFIHVKLICFLNAYCNTTIFPFSFKGKSTTLLTISDKQTD